MRKEMEVDVKGEEGMLFSRRTGAKKRVSTPPLPPDTHRLTGPTTNE
jgi:hypothetical protein